MIPRNAEDSQPNENLRKRKGSNLPPVIRVTAPPPKQQTTNRGGYHPYRGRGRVNGSRGGHGNGPSSSYRGGGRGRPPGFVHSLPARPSGPQEQQPRNSTNRTFEPQGTDTNSHRPSHLKNDALPEPSCGPVAGPSNSTPRVKGKQQERRRRRPKHPHNKDKNNQLRSSKRVKIVPTDIMSSRPSSPQGYHQEQAEDSRLSSSIDIPIASGSNANLSQPTNNLSSSNPLNSEVPNKGTLRISPLPADCESGHPLAVVNRSIWTAMKRTELVRNGLSVAKASIIDNGLVLEWTCSTSVDSDLLRWLEEQGESYVYSYPAQPMLPGPSSSQPSPTSHSDSGQPETLIVGLNDQHDVGRQLPSSDYIRKEQSLPFPPAPDTVAALDHIPEVSITDPPVKLEAHEAQMPSPVSTHTLTRNNAVPTASTFPYGDHIKNERDDSPISIQDIRPCRQGTYRIPSLPPNCRSGYYNYKKNRRDWVAIERKKLLSKGLAIQKVVLRDDGLAFDWTSEIPIMPDTLLPPTDLDTSPPDPGPSTTNRQSPQGSPMQTERTRSASLLELSPPELAHTSQMAAEQESAPSLAVSEQLAFSTFSSTAHEEPTGSPHPTSSEIVPKPSNDTPNEEHSPGVGLGSFVDVFVDRVGTFLKQYFRNLAQDRLNLDGLYIEDAKLTIEVSPHFHQCMPHVPSGVCQGLRTITPVLNAFPPVLKTAFEDQSVDEKVTVLKTKDNTVVLEVTCGIIACDAAAVLDTVTEQVAVDSGPKVWMGHEFILDPSSDCLKIIFHKILLKFTY